jgi:CheY-like chemotaxis protein
VAFLDVSMPDVPGSELANWLRQEFEPGELTIVAVTGHERKHDRVREGAFDRHLLKPASVDAVAAVLMEIARER